MKRDSKMMMHMVRKKRNKKLRALFKPNLI
jgi:hypothetical protein